MTLRRWLSFSGAVGIVLIALAFGVVGSGTPDGGDKATAAEVVSFYREHKTGQLIATLMVAIGAALLVLFAARLRELLQGDASILSGASFGGMVILASGLLLMASVHFALVVAADHRQSAVAQTLNVLDNNDFFGLVGGLAVLMLAAGIATVRNPVLPRWLGWAAVVIGVLSLAGPVGFIGGLLGALWILVVGIMLTMRQDAVAAPA